MPTVFVTRKLLTENHFQRILESEGFSVEGWSMVAFGKIDPAPILPTTDWIFFYSKNAVKYFLKLVGSKLNNETQFACMGKSTADYMIEQGLQCSFSGIGNSEKIIGEFKLLAKGKSVLFPRALHSLKSIQRGLGDYCKVHDLPIYTNVPVQKPKLSKADYLVFTSPMNVEVYLEHHKVKKSQKLIAIGNSTGKKLMHLTKRKVFISPRPEEKGLAAFVLLVHDLAKSEN